MLDLGSVSLAGWLLSVVGSILVITFALMLADRLSFGLKVDSFWTALASGFSIGVLFWLLQLVFFGVRIFDPSFLTGVLSWLVLWVLAAVVLVFVAWLRRGFEIESFGRAMIAVVVMALLIVGMNAVLGLFV